MASRTASATHTSLGALVSKTVAPCLTMREKAADMTKCSAAYILVVSVPWPVSLLVASLCCARASIAWRPGSSEGTCDQPIEVAMPREPTYSRKRTEASVAQGPET